MTCTLTAAANTAAIFLDQGSQMSISTGTVSITNNGTAKVLEAARGATVTGAQGAAPVVTYAGTGGVALTGGQYQLTAGSVTIPGPVGIDGGAFRVESTLTVSPASGDAITVKNGGALAHNAGVLTATPTSGSALVVLRGGKANLLATTNCVLTGTGAGVGCSAAGGGSVTFDGAPTSVTGPASADLKVGGAAAQANTVLALAEDGLTDGLGAVIMRTV